MVLTAAECKLLQSTWQKVQGHIDCLGADTLFRMFTVYPVTKTYFPHFDLSQGSQDIKNHGRKVIRAIENALKHTDNLRGCLAELSDLHAYNLRVDPVNFKLLAKCLLVELATYLRAEFTPMNYLAWDKFMECMGEVLCEKYR
ncbi:hemoglobin subunit alpha-D-like [Hemicordylus capensis]|uniref:hemoglobin subunit alpha-D-like n=1 Tax=Hemicordylus capensis TaxID=884348 RepID=UPI00230491B2|nr:hemoglobin subunit alpha-D-like [Hemicordylus capensis]